MAEAPNQHLTREEQGFAFAVKTWRYLRLALVGLVVGLLASVAYEHRLAQQHFESGPPIKSDCFQTSLSAYYYTPVHGYFVSALVAMGVCMFCLKGSTPAEDRRLKVGGLCAVIVGLVPTPKTGSCASVLGTIDDRNANIANNVRGLIAVAVVALVASAIFWGKEGRHESASRKTFWIMAAVAVVAIGIFFADKDLFRGKAHGVAAGLLFACVTAVVFINGLNRTATKPEVQQTLFAKIRQRLFALVRDRYGFIGSVMVLFAAAVFVSKRNGFDHWALVGELGLIALFAIFWLVQTIELWNKGLR